MTDKDIYDDSTEALERGLREDGRKLALHEAGHCLGFRLEGRKILYATIIPSCKSDGHVQADEYNRGATLKTENSVVTFLLGHAAELEFGFTGEFGHASDYRESEGFLKNSIRYRKSDAWALAHGYLKEDGNPKFLYERCDFPLYSDYRSWLRAKRVSKGEWKPEFDRLRCKARRLAKKHHDYIEKAANLLLRYNTLQDRDIPYLATAAGSAK